MKKKDSGSPEEPRYSAKGSPAEWAAFLKPGGYSTLPMKPPPRPAQPRKPWEPIDEENTE